METVQIGSLCFVVTPEVADVPEQPCSDPVTKSKQKAKPLKQISQVKQILARARLQKVENVRLVGHGGLINEPVITNGWLVMPLAMYDGIIPREAMETAKKLTKDIPIKGLLVADDLRKVQQKQPTRPVVNETPTYDWKRIATGAGRVAAIVAVAGAVISIFPLVLGIGALVTAFAYDPLLIAVTAEDEWVCLYEWWH